MSADKTTGEWGDLKPDRRRQRDPYDIIPDDFPYQSIEDARRAAESGFGDANRTDPRCPECETTDIRFKQGQTASDASHRRPEDYHCMGCGAHFDEPKPPIAETNGDQVTI